MSKYKQDMSDSKFEAILVEPSLGKGGARTVYQVRDDPIVVIKKADPRFLGANGVEWDVWHAVKEGPWSQVFGGALQLAQRTNI
jgi:hypothetical protein